MTALKLFKMGKFTLFMSQFPFYPIFTFRVKNSESKTEFANNSLNSPKIGKLNIDTLIIPQGVSTNEKNRVQKSHATVLLMQNTGVR